MCICVYMEHQCVHVESAVEETRVKEQADKKTRQYVTEQQVEHMLKMKEDILKGKLVLVLDKTDREETKTKGTTKKLRPV